MMFPSNNNSGGNPSLSNPNTTASMLNFTDNGQDRNVDIAGLNTSASNVLSAISGVGAIAAQIKAAVNAAKSEILAVQRETIASVNTTKSKAVAELNVAKSKAVTDINTARNKAIADINSAKGSQPADNSHLTSALQLAELRPSAAITRELLAAPTPSVAEKQGVGNE